MARISTDQATVLQAVVDRLQDQIPEFAGTACFVSDSPDPGPGVDKNLFCTVAPTDGIFEQDNQDGGGAENLIEDGGVAITVFSAMKLDRHDSRQQALLHEQRGLLRFKKLILKALTGHDLQSPAGDELLANLMHALRASQPGEDAHGRIYMQLTFSTDFGWDLS